MKAISFKHDASSPGSPSPDFSELSAASSASGITYPMTRSKRRCTAEQPIVVKLLRPSSKPRVVPQDPLDEYDAQMKEIRDVLGEVWNFDKNVSRPTISFSIEYKYQIVRDLCRHKFAKEAQLEWNQLAEFGAFADRFIAAFHQHVKDYVSAKRAIHLASGRHSSIYPHRQLSNKIFFLWQSFKERQSIIDNVFAYHLSTFNAKNMGEASRCILRDRILPCPDFIDTEGNCAVMEWIWDILDGHKSSDESHELESCSIVLELFDGSEQLGRIPILFEHFIYLHIKSKCLQPVSSIAEFITIYSKYSNNLQGVGFISESYSSNLCRTLLGICLPEDAVFAALNATFTASSDTEATADITKFRSFIGESEFRRLWVTYIDEGLKLILNRNEKLSMGLFEQLMEFLTSVWETRQTWFDSVSKSMQNSQWTQSLSSSETEAIRSHLSRKDLAVHLAVYLAKYIDTNMRALASNPNRKLWSQFPRDPLATVLNHMISRDRFELEYQRDLSRRLLKNKNAPISRELEMIIMIKKTLGESEKISQLSFMVHDIQESKHVSSEFSQNSTANHGETQLEVKLLSKHNWPEAKAIDFKIPRELVDLKESFEKFHFPKAEPEGAEVIEDGKRYVKVNTLRKFQWNSYLGMCTINVNLPRCKDKTLVLNQLQTCILLLFNDQNTLSLATIATQLGLDIKNKDLFNALISLLRLQLLSKNSKAPAIMSSDLFSINLKFTDKKSGRQTGSSSSVIEMEMKDDDEDAAANAKLEKELVRNRIGEVQAVIVRILKNYRRLAAEKLVDAVYEATLSRGALEKGQILEQIDLLHRQEVISREGDIYAY